MAAEFKLPPPMRLGQWLTRVGWELLRPGISVRRPRSWIGYALMCIGAPLFNVGLRVDLWLHDRWMRRHGYRRAA